MTLGSDSAIPTRIPARLHAWIARLTQIISAALAPPEDGPTADPYVVTAQNDVPTDADWTRHDQMVAAVRRGATHLDARRFEWYAEIDLDQLDLDDAQYCIVGQLFPHRAFHRAVENLLPDETARAREHLPGLAATVAVARAYGFVAPEGNGHDDYHILASLWRAAIVERLYDLGDPDSVHTRH